MREGYYRSTPDLPAFSAAFARSRSPLCYNGNLLRPEHAEKVMSTVWGLDRLMLGRGAVTNPALFRQLRGGPALEKHELFSYLEALLAANREAGIDEGFCLGRMKEVLYYVNHMFPGAERQVKQINKARSLADYRDALSALFASSCFDPGAAFPGEAPALHSAKDG